MPTYTYYAYAPGAIVYNSGSNSWSLRPDYDPYQHRVEIRITDDDAYIDGDWVNGEIGDDTNQTAQVFDLSGNLIASGRVYAESYIGVQHPDRHTSEFDVLEIGGVPIGYVAEEPLLPGVSYTQTVSGNVGTASNTGYGDTRQLYSNLESIACFASGTMISSEDGEMPVDWLRPGDRILTRDSGYQPVAWIGRFTATAANPVQIVNIAPDAFGPGSPDYPLCVTANHQILLQDPSLELLFGEPEMLAAAKFIVTGDAVTLEESCANRIFYHVLLPDHEVILAQGVWVESLFAGDQVLAGQPGRIRSMITEKTMGRHRQTARACLRSFEVPMLNRRRFTFACQNRPNRRSAAA